MKGVSVKFLYNLFCLPWGNNLTIIEFISNKDVSLMCCSRYTRHSCCKSCNWISRIKSINCHLKSLEFSFFNEYNDLMQSSVCGYSSTSRFLPVNVDLSWDRLDKMLYFPFNHSTTETPLIRKITKDTMIGSFAWFVITSIKWRLWRHTVNRYEIKDYF